MSDTVSPVRPFVDFYTEKGVIPTRQNITNISQHFQRREALYRQLGLVPSLLKGISILEFGPGSGHNALYTASCHPKQYVLVDATPASLSATQAELFRQYPKGNFIVVDCDILNFCSQERFDLVLCEGVIPTQKDPGSFLQHVASFACTGGVVVGTCMDSISLLPEMLRRYIAREIIAHEHDFQKQVQLLLEFFTEDLNYLPGMSRRREDWVIDQLLHPWIGPLFSIPEAIDAIGANFDIYGTSPAFITDWRWYKDICKDGFEFNQRTSEQFFTHAHNFLDFRHIVSPVPSAINRKLKQQTDDIYDRIFANEQTIQAYGAKELQADLLRVIEALPKAHQDTLEALNDFIFCLSKERFDELEDFRKLWGRGQQYLSFIKR